VSVIAGFVSQNDLTWVSTSAECRFILLYKWEENLGIQAGVHLIWGPLNTGFTVLKNSTVKFFLLIMRRNFWQSLKKLCKQGSELF